MKPQIGVVTLAVKNLERALAFYRALGLKSLGVTATEFAGDDTHPAGAIVMFRLNGGQILALYPRSELAKDAGIPQGPAQSGEFSLGHIVATRDEVDALLAKAKAAGAPVTALHDRPWGIYSGYFRDLDGDLGKSSTIQTTPMPAPDRAISGPKRIPVETTTVSVAIAEFAGKNR